MERAREKRPGQSVVMKINVEGSAGLILMAASAAVLAPVVEIHLDYDPGLPYDTTLPNCSIIWQLPDSARRTRSARSG
jgi:hypothetical protein